MSESNTTEKSSAKVAIVGSRDIDCEAEVRAYVRILPPWATVISGGARGVDTWAVNEALKQGMKTLVILPDWDLHGKAAGMIRNGQIVAEADQVTAFWDGKSKGTANTIARARKAGKVVVVVDFSTRIAPEASAGPRYAPIPGFRNEEPVTSNDRAEATTQEKK